MEGRRDHVTQEAVRVVLWPILVILTLLFPFASTSGSSSSPSSSTYNGDQQQQPWQQPQQRQQHFLYVVREGVAPLTVVGDLSRDLKLELNVSQAASTRPTFTLMPSGQGEPGSSSSSSSSSSLSFSQHLSLNISTGIILTTAQIDRDQYCPRATTCDVTQRVSVHPTPQLFNLVDITISILDNNDNGPEFIEYERGINFTISESATVGSLFPLPATVDIDSPPNAVTNYTLEQSPPLSLGGFFGLKLLENRQLGIVDLRLELIHALDRELRDRHELILVAKDADQPLLSSTLNILITVTDSNDNRPQFIQSVYNVSVSEATSIGSVIARVSAVDHDIGVNGLVRYALTGRSQGAHGDLFNVDSITGEIRLRRTFDYSAQSEYSLGVVARDLGEFSIPAVASVFVRVTEVNDHSPEIVFEAMLPAGNSETGGTVVVIPRESIVGTQIGHVTARDADDATGSVTCLLTPNDVIIYSDDVTTTTSFSNDDDDDNADYFSEYFHLTPVFDSEYRLVTVRSFHNTTSTTFSFAVECIDSGSPPLSSAREIVIVTTDAPKGAPVLTRTVYRVAVRENSVSALLRVSASIFVLASGQTNCGEIKYSLSQDPSNPLDVSSSFLVNPLSGKISNLVPLDRELISRVTFNVTATVECRFDASAGGATVRELTSRAQVIIDVDDEDDELPQFTKREYSFEVLENVRPRTVVGRVSADDRDEPPFNRYEFFLEDDFWVAGGRDEEKGVAGSRNWSSFEVDRTTGDIFVTSALDREAQDKFELVVKVRPARRLANGEEGMTIVALENKTKSKPEKSQNLEAAHSFAKVPRSLISASSSSLSPSSLPDENDGRTKSDVVIVLILILDVNDNAPVIVSPPAETLDQGMRGGEDVRHVWVYWGLSPGRRVTRIVAVDKDQGENAMLIYRLVETNGTRYFDLNETSGDVILLSSLSSPTSVPTTRCCINTSFHLLISVEDSGTPRQMSLVVLVITVTDSPLLSVADDDDAAPLFQTGEWFSRLSLVTKAVAVVVVAMICITIVVLIVMAVCLMNRRCCRYGKCYCCCCCCCGGGNLKQLDASSVVIGGIEMTVVGQSVIGGCGSGLGCGCGRRGDLRGVERKGGVRACSGCCCHMDVVDGALLPKTGPCSSDYGQNNRDTFTETMDPQRTSVLQLGAPKPAGSDQDSDSGCADLSNTCCHEEDGIIHRDGGTEEKQRGWKNIEETSFTSAYFKGNHRANENIYEPWPTTYEAWPSTSGEWPTASGACSVACGHCHEVEPNCHAHGHCDTRPTRPLPLPPVPVLSSLNYLTETTCRCYKQPPKCLNKPVDDNHNLGDQKNKKLVDDKEYSDNVNDNKVDTSIGCSKIVDKAETLNPQKLLSKRKQQPADDKTTALSDCDQKSMSAMTSQDGGCRPKDINTHVKNNSSVPKGARNVANTGVSIDDTSVTSDNKYNDRKERLSSGGGGGQQGRGRRVHFADKDEYLGYERNDVDDVIKDTSPIEYIDDDEVQDVTDIANKVIGLQDTTESSEKTSWDVTDDCNNCSCSSLSNTPTHRAYSPVASCPSQPPSYRKYIDFTSPQLKTSTAVSPTSTSVSIPSPPSSSSSHLSSSPFSSSSSCIGLSTASPYSSAGRPIPSALNASIYIPALPHSSVTSITCPPPLVSAMIPISCPRPTYSHYIRYNNGVKRPETDAILTTFHSQDGSLV